MTIARFARALAAAIAFLGLAAVPTNAQQQAPPDSVRAMMTEFQQIQQQLGSIQSRALDQNPTLQQKQAAVQQTVEATMKQLHPELEQGMARLDTLRTELADAQAQQDMAKLQSLLMEGQQIQQQLQAAEAEALEREDVAQQVEAYRSELIEEMKTVAPETEALIERLEQLAMRIQATMPPPQPGSGPQPGSEPESGR